jgi:hypothetical protein
MAAVTLNPVYEFYPIIRHGSPGAIAFPYCRSGVGLGIRDFHGGSIDASDYLWRILGGSFDISPFRLEHVEDRSR